MSYQACPGCGSTKVVRKTSPADEPGHERVTITCYGCERRRATYVRRAKVSSSGG